MLSTTQSDWQRQIFVGHLRSAGLEFDEFSLVVVPAGGNPACPEGYLSVNFIGDSLTFDVLAKISELMGTRKIDIDCEHGCSSDPCHERVITIRGAQGL